MNSKEDHDIKIFKTEKVFSDAETVELLESMNHHRANGNIVKAHELGLVLADLCNDDFIIEKFQKNLKTEENITLQIFSLVVFSVEAGLNCFLPAVSLSAISLDSFHGQLSKINMPLYKKAMKLSSYSFYYLSVRKIGKNVEEEIGKNFAMLCQEENSKNYIHIGMKIYRELLETVSEKVKEKDFKN